MFPLLLVSRKRPLSHTFLLGYYALVFCLFLTFRKIPSDIWLLGCAQWIPQGQPYDDLAPVNTNTGTGIGKTMFLLSLRTRATTNNSSFDNARTMNCSLNNNTSHDPIMKSCFTIQPLQKNYFTRSICSAIVSCLREFLQDHKRFPSSTSTTSVHSKNVSIMIGSSKKQEQQVRGSKEFGQGERYFWGFRVVRLPLL